MKKLFLFWKSDIEMVGESMEPKGVHHTVSFATSYDETWSHIRKEVRTIHSDSPNLMPEERVLTLMQRAN